MKKILLCGTLLVASAILVSACSGDDDDDGGSGTITSGSYNLSNANVTPDGCNFGTAFYQLVLDNDILTADVDVTGTTAEVTFGPVGPFPYEISGTTLADSGNPYPFSIACATTGANGSFRCGSRLYNATLTGEQTYEGTITGSDAFTLQDEYVYSACTGADCTIVLGSSFGGATLPCTSVDQIDLAK